MQVTVCARVFYPFSHSPVESGALGTCVNADTLASASAVSAPLSFVSEKESHIF